MAVREATEGRTKSRVKEPRRYHVVMHNDDYTPMDFVVQILIEIFGKNKENAVRIMLEVHKGGRAVVGTYSYDIAATKVRTAAAIARDEGYPFRLTMEEA